MRLSMLFGMPCRLAAGLTVLLLIPVSTAWAHIDQLRPPAVSVGVATFELTVFGSDLEPSERLLWNGTPLETRWISSTAIVARIPNTLTTQPGNVTITLEGFNSLTFVINPRPVIVTPSPLPAAPVNVRYSQPLAAALGTPGFAWRLGPTSSLPPGLSLDSTGVISGTATNLGLFTFSLEVTDIGGGFASKPFVLATYDPSCTVSLSSGAAAFPADGGSGQLDVTAPAGCPWAAGSVESWIYVQQASGTGGGTIRYQIGTNSGASRTGTITVSGRVFTVTQSAAPSGCTYSISPTSGEASTPSTGIIQVTAPAGCGWRAFTRSTWIVLSGVQGTGSGSVRYEVGPNPGTTRLDSIQIADQTFRLTQYGTCPSSSYSLSPRAQVLDWDDQTGTLITVTAPGNCGWSASSIYSWIRPFGAGSGDGTVGFSVTQNRGSWRQGTISVGGQTVIITQNSTDKCFLDFLFGLLTGIGSGGGEADLPRAFRDTVLSATPQGRRYTDLYYRFSGEAIRAALFDPSLLWKTHGMLKRYRPLLQSVINGQGATLSEQDLADMDGLLRAFGSRASPEMGSAIQELRRDLRDPNLRREFGITLKGAQERHGGAR